jgi:hypothetical protein
VGSELQSRVVKMAAIEGYAELDALLVLINSADLVRMSFIWVT